MTQTTEEQKLNGAAAACLRTRKYRPLHPLLCPVALCLGMLVSACSDSSLPTPDPTTDLTTPQVQPSAEQLQNPDITPVVVIESGNDNTTQELPVSIIAPDHGEHAGATHSVSYTDSSLDIWPPQPQNITEIASLDVDTVNPTDSLAKTVRTIKSSDSFSSLFGARHEILARHEIRDKSGNLISSTIEVFDYDASQIATIELAANGRTVVRHTVKATHLYQPPESQNEVRQAIALAVIALDQQGFTNHNALKGTGLLAYPTAAQTAASGFNFFSDRKIYVTLGVGQGVLPEYRALVNLSTGVVESSGAIQ